MRSKFYRRVKSFCLPAWILRGLELTVGERPHSALCLLTRAIRAPPDDPPRALGAERGCRGRRRRPRGLRWRKRTAAAAGENLRKPNAAASSLRASDRVHQVPARKVVLLDRRRPVLSVGAPFCNGAASAASLETSAVIKRRTFPRPLSFALARCAEPSTPRNRPGEAVLAPTRSCLVSLSSCSFIPYYHSSL